MRRAISACRAYREDLVEELLRIANGRVERVGPVVRNGGPRAEVVQHRLAHAELERAELRRAVRIKLRMLGDVLVERGAVDREDVRIVIEAFRA